MIRTLPRILPILLLFVNSLPAQQAPVADDAYLINPGDVLEISVWREEALQQQVLVRPDGAFSFPLAGEIKAKNKSVEQVQQELTKRLEMFIPDLVVTVSVLEINGNRVYVIGQVNNPGVFIVNPQVDVLQALSMAGGTTPFADLNDINVLRRENGKQIAIKFRYNDIVKGKRLDQNILLRAGDVVVVP